MEGERSRKEGRSGVSTKDKSEEAASETRAERLRSIDSDGEIEGSTTFWEAATAAMVVVERGGREIKLLVSVGMDDQLGRSAVR